MSGEKEYALKYADTKLGVSLEIITPKKRGQFQKEERYYFIDGDKAEYRTPIELMEALYLKGAR